MGENKSDVVEPGETLFSLKGAEELPTYLFFACDEKMEMVCSPLGGPVFTPGREPWGVPRSGKNDQIRRSFLSC